MSNWSGKQKKAFARCLDGLRKANLLGLNVRFLTLTTPACNGEALSNDEKKEFIQLQWRKLYGKLKKNDSYDIDEYFSVRTSEGNGVIHIVFTGDYIPFNYIMEEWVKINGTPFIWICDPYKKFNDDRAVARYFVSQYVGFKQNIDFVYGFSRNWVYSGSGKDYKACKRLSHDYDREPIFINFYGEPLYYVDYDRLNDIWFSWLENKFLLNRWNDVDDMVYDLY